MKRTRISIHFLLTCIFLTSPTVVHSYDLFDRQASTCAATGFTQCSQAGLPSNFCCASGTTCLALAGNTTALCCPSGNNCQTIQPIPCILSLQNATANPSNALKTTALTGTLPTCGDQCCPFGYTCNSAGSCILDADQSKAPVTSLLPSSTATVSSLTSPVPTSTSSARPSSISPLSSSLISSTTIKTPPSTQTSSISSTTSTTPLTAVCAKFPTVAVLAGFFPGLVAGILLTVLTVCLLGAKRRRAARRDSDSSFGNISDPQPIAGDMRTDFLRKPPQTPSTTAASSPGRTNTIRRVKSLFRKSTSTAAGTLPSTAHSDHPAMAPVPLMAQRGEGGLPRQQREVPVTPPLQREPSYEDINIFADGDTASALRARQKKQGGGPTTLRGQRDTTQTTFSDMMKQSGLSGVQNGQPYVYRGTQESPRRVVTPR